MEEENCLAKRSCNTHQITFTQLERLYGLDPSVPAFRALRQLWEKDAASRPLLALLCACARDPLLREAAPFILRHKPGAEVSARAVADFLEKENPGRFSPATLHSASRNIRSTFTQSGHLQGRSRKTRVRCRATPAAAAYALYLGRLGGLVGGELLQTIFTALLDCDAAEAFDLAQTAAQKGWLDLKRVGDIVEIEFPNWPCPNGRYPNGRYPNDVDR